MATRPRLSVGRKPHPKTGNRSSLSINLLSLINPSTIAPRALRPTKAVENNSPHAAAGL